MLLKKFTAYMSLFNPKTYPFRLILLIVEFSILGGCAAESAFQDSDTLAAMRSNAKKSSYHRSYLIKGKTDSPRHTFAGCKANGKASWFGTEYGNRTVSPAQFAPNGLIQAQNLANSV
jgi:hypothetical protein